MSRLVPAINLARIETRDDAARDEALEALVSTSKDLGEKDQEIISRGCAAIHEWRKGGTYRPVVEAMHEAAWASAQANRGGEAARSWVMWAARWAFAVSEKTDTIIANGEMKPSGRWYYERNIREQVLHFLKLGRS